MNKPLIYLDYHATTPTDPEVVNAMMPYFTTHFGNAASRSHRFGWQADEAVQMAREQIAGLLHADPAEIFFTSGATEGLNLLIKGTAHALRKKGKHIITIATEHHAVLDTIDFLSKEDFDITILQVANDGSIDVEDIQRQIRQDTIMVVAMWANNETGVIHPVKEIGDICRQQDVVFVCDGTQALGKMDVNPGRAGIRMMAFSSHKFYGPKGVGAVYVDATLALRPTPLIHGGGHEKGMRSGTLNVPGIVGMGAAARLLQTRWKDDVRHMKSLRDHLEKTLLSQISLARVNGDLEHRLPSVTNLRIPYTDAQTVMAEFRNQLAISSGSACSSADPAPSHVLLAMGLSERQVKNSLRFSLGRMTTIAEIEAAANLCIQAVEKCRKTNPVWEMAQSGMDLGEFSET